MNIRSVHYSIINDQVPSGEHERFKTSSTTV